MRAGSRASSAWILICLFAFATTWTGCNQPGSDRTGTVFPIEGGEPSRAFAATGAFVDGQGQQFCTATLVDSDLLLTAAHCFALSQVNISAAEFVLGADLENAPVRAGLDSVTIHPDFNASNFNYTLPDVAVVRLATPIDEVLPVVVHFGDAGDLVGRDMILVGYGRTAGDNVYGTRRHATVTVNNLTETKLRYEFQGSGGCNGDSGGPAFVLFDEGYRQVGTTSGGDNSCQGEGYYNRLDGDFATWLHSQGVREAERERQCGSDQTCDGQCFADADCDPVMCEGDGCTTDVCGADGECNPDCGDQDPDCEQPDPCAADGVCNQECGDQDPDCEQPDPCAADGVCNQECGDQDPDCEQPDPCVADGICNQECGDQDPDCEQPDPCDQDGTCNGFWCGYNDPDCDPCFVYGLYDNGACDPNCPFEDPDCQDNPPPCYFVERVVENGFCYYYDVTTGELCGAYQLYCNPYGCYCPY